MNYFPNSDEEIALIKFIAKYQYLAIDDSKYFFNTQKYYRTRIYRLINKGYLKKVQNNLVLDDMGIEYAKICKFEYIQLNRNKKYMARLKYISSLGAYFNRCDNINFKPSFLIKDKEVLTKTARKYIGILEINRIEYLTYYIAEEHDIKYINNVIYDIQKEHVYKNIIVFVNDISRISMQDFTFGANQVLIIEDTDANREKLKFLNSVNWHSFIDKYYKGKAHLSSYRFCDFTDYDDKYISIFYFLDTEKINRIKYFLRENKNKKMQI